MDIDLVELTLAMNLDLSGPGLQFPHFDRAVQKKHSTRRSLSGPTRSNRTTSNFQPRRHGATAPHVTAPRRPTPQRMRSGGS